MTDDDQPYSSVYDEFFAGVRHIRQGDRDHNGNNYEILDAETIKARLAEQHASVLKADGNTTAVQLVLQGRASKKTKALTSDMALTKDFNKIIIYCPTCQGFGSTRRMMPYQLKILNECPETYAQLVGGLPFEEDTIFLHCSYCNLRLLPSIDEVEKLDARTDDEYEIESLADVRKKHQKPIIAGQSTTGRYNRAKQNKDETFKKRKRQAMEQMVTDFENKKSQGLPQ